MLQRIPPLGTQFALVVVTAVVVTLVLSAPAFAITTPQPRAGSEGLDQARMLGADRATPASATLTNQLPRARSSDPRAEFFEGNVVRCDQVGFPGSVQVGSQNSGASDGQVAAEVEGKELNVTILDPGVVIDAVVVKGGNGYNLYSDPSFLPPVSAPPQEYISPLNAGGNVPDISHWFVCYHLETPPPVGSLTVLKVVIKPDGVPVEPLPETYLVEVTCGDDDPFVVEFDSGGGRSISDEVITEQPAGSVCTIVEQTATPAGTVVSYDPPGANTEGVTIPEDAGVVVSVVNDFRETEVQTAQVQVNKVVIPPPVSATLPEQYSAHLQCDDGTDVPLALPGIGGMATPEAVTVKVGSMCMIEESTDALPAGWTVTYTVGDGEPSQDPPVFVVESTATVPVWVTNDPNTAAPTTTTSLPTSTTVPVTTVTTTPPEPTATSSGTGGGNGTLPVTGGDNKTVAALALGSVLGGLGLMAVGRRRGDPGLG